MVKLCSNCKKEIKPGRNFCGFCGRSVKEKVRHCGKCNEVLEDIETFCPMCGEKYIDTDNIEIIKSSYIENKDALNTGTLVSIFDNNTLRFLRGTGEDEKKAVRKLKKEFGGGKWSNNFFLYNKQERLTFIRRDNSSYIESYSYDNVHVPFRKYTVSNEVDYVWGKSIYAQEQCYFFHDFDAFFAWDSYIFISVYEGKIVWSAADTRDVCNLPSKNSDVVMYYGGRPQLEFLPNGNIRSEHFYNNAECKLVKGVFIPIKEK